MAPRQLLLSAQGHRMRPILRLVHRLVQVLGIELSWTLPIVLRTTVRSITVASQHNCSSFSDSNRE